MIDAIGAFRSRAHPHIKSTRGISDSSILLAGYLDKHLASPSTEDGVGHTLKEQARHPSELNDIWDFLHGVSAVPGLKLLG